MAEYDTAIKSALLNWTTGIAYNLIRYNTHNGFDAWRKLCNRYVPFAEDLQDILIQELVSLKPVSENEIDVLFKEIERIIDLYVKAGPADDLSQKWIRAAVLRNLPEKITTALALELKKADSVDEIQSIINVHLHEHRTGLPRGTPGPMIAMTETEKTESAEANGQQKTSPPKELEPFEQHTANTINS